MKAARTARRSRRQRRQFKQLLAFGPGAKPTHKARGGRTGQVHFRGMAAKADGVGRATEKAGRSEVVTRLPLVVPFFQRLGGFGEQ